MKFILAASAAVLAATPVSAQLNITRGDAFAIRSCPVNGDMTRGVCYNQDRSVQVGEFVLRETDRAYTIDCERKLLNSIGKEFCPIRDQLAPAPFLF